MITTDHVAAIADLLAQLMNTGEGSFLVLSADDTRNYYIQFIPWNRPRSLYGEAVSNNILSGAARLDQEQVARLGQLGWLAPGPGEVNFSQTWDEVDVQRRQEIARLVMQTFTQVYGLPADVPLSVQLESG